MLTIDTGISLYVEALISDKIDQLSSICLRKTVNVSRLLNDQALQFELANFFALFSLCRGIQ